MKIITSLIAGGALMLGTALFAQETPKAAAPATQTKVKKHRKHKKDAKTVVPATSAAPATASPANPAPKK